MSFRKDINGLRAIAVIAVVLFHFNVNGFSGGFSGVDMFFVISGFLMTRIIFKGMEKNHFSVLSFYISRAKRIIPSLIFLCFVLLILGWFYLTPIMYQTLGKHVASSISFVSNFVYLSESGYFDVESHKKWLLHTWSLSVEWQFYIIYPLLLVYIRKYFSIYVLKVSLVLMTVSGFLISIITSSFIPDFSYYVLPSRMWEMTMGGLAYVYPWAMVTNKNKRYIEWIGLVLIIASVVFISKEDTWPGYLAAVPVLGVFFVIQAQQNNSFWVSNVAIQKIGTWSYSIYLWHWPLVVFMHFEYEKMASYIIMIFVVMSIFLGGIFYYLIEKNNFFKRGSVLVSVTLVSFFAGLVVYHFMPNKIMHPIPDNIISSMERRPYDCFDKDFFNIEKMVTCTLKKGNEKILAIGDSHMYSTLPVIEKIAEEQHMNLVYFGYSGCPPLLSVYPIRGDQGRKDCHQLNKQTYIYAIKNNVDIVYMAARWTYYTRGDYDNTHVQHLSLNSAADKKDRVETVKTLYEGIRNTFKRYGDTAIKVVVLLQVPLQKSNPDLIYYNSLDNSGVSLEALAMNSIESSVHASFQQSINDYIREEATKYVNIHVVDPTKVFCEDKGHCVVGNGQESYYFDDDHLSIKGSYRLHDQLKPFFKSKELDSHAATNGSSLFN